MQFALETETITISLKEYNALNQTIADLQLLVLSLQEQIRLLKNGGKSNTSSTPPSFDIGRSNKKSLRPSSNLKSGGQPGHKGSNLKMADKADEIIEYRPSFCLSCGEALNGSTGKFVSRKQEIEIPPIVPKYIEHQSYSCSCASCGYETVSQLPDYLKANIQYGARIQALVGMFSVQQYIPFKRMTQIMSSVFNISLSQGTVNNILKSLTLKAEPAYEYIRKGVEKSAVVGGDETGCKINGGKNGRGWFFVFQTTLLTFISVSLSRGFINIASLFKNGFPMSVYVTDCLSAQLKVKAKLHQICTAHLLRELNNFIDACDCEWSKKMKLLFQKAINLKKELTENDYLYENEGVTMLEKELDLLLKTEPENKHKKLRAFKNRLNKNREAIFTFLHHPKVPPDNNGSERAIRNVKVKMKVSGQFKTLYGAHCFAVMRSIIDTTNKNAQNVFNALTNLAKLGC